jgi:hypothetical protein
LVLTRSQATALNGSTSAGRDGVGHQLVLAGFDRRRDSRLEDGDAALDTACGDLGPTRRSLISIPMALASSEVVARTTSTAAAATVPSAASSRFEAAFPSMVRASSPMAISPTPGMGTTRLPATAAAGW